MSHLIYYKHSGRIHGPIDAGQIQKLMHLGQTDSSDLWSSDGITWNSLDSLQLDTISAPNSPPIFSAHSPDGHEVSVIPHHGRDHKRNTKDQTEPDFTTGNAFPLKGFLVICGSLLGVLLVLAFLIFIRPGPQRPPEEDPLPQGGQIPNAKNPKEGQPKPAQAANGRHASKEILEKHGKSIALIRRATDNNPVVGSGFLFKSGYLMTTADIAGDDRGILISVMFPAGDADERGPHQARIHHHDPATGIAILRLDAPQLPIPLSDAGLLKAGEDLIVLASPGFSAPREPMNTEVVNVSYLTTTTKKDLEFHRISTKTKPSQAGAPILDTKGNAVGMIASPITPDDPLCITSRQILKILKDVNLP